MQNQGFTPLETPDAMLSASTELVQQAHQSQVEHNGYIHGETSRDGKQNISGEIAVTTPDGAVSIGAYPDGGRSEAMIEDTDGTKRFVNVNTPTDQVFVRTVSPSGERTMTTDSAEASRIYDEAVEKIAAFITKHEAESKEDEAA
ncbi:hypothetical protein BH09PAT3_BH09PAT3_6620 [soil metagenome]